MTAKLYLAPAAAGKTEYVLNVVREAARGLRAIPRVVVPTYLQVRAWRHRMGEPLPFVGTGSGSRARTTP
jgi:hypothetical protein